MGGENPDYVARVQRLPCRARERFSPCTPCRGRIEAHHAGRRPGIAMKAHDETCIPMCHQHHVLELHALAGVFRGFTKETLRAWQDREIVETQALLADQGSTPEFW